MAKAAAKKKKEKELNFEMPTGSPRTWTVEQRRNALAYLRKDTKSDHRIYGKDFQEILVPYGHFVFDKVLRLGGIARGGRITQIHGNEGAGKTTTAFVNAANYQQATGEPIAIFEYNRPLAPSTLTLSVLTPTSVSSSSRPTCKSPSSGIFSFSPNMVSATSWMTPSRSCR